MATITFDSSSVLTSATTITVSTSYYTNYVIAGADLGITNTKTNVFKIYNPLPQLDISVVGNKSKAFVSGNPIGSPNFTDGVLNINLFFEDGDATDWQSDSYILVTTQIDADIAAYPLTTFFERGNLVAIQYIRQQIDIAFAAEDYTLTNTLIGACQYYLTATQNGSTTPNTSAITITDNSLLFLNVVSNPSGATPNISQYNEVLNTLFGSPIAFTNTSLIPSGTGSMNISSTEIYNDAYFKDGVYQAKNYYTSPFYLNNDDYTIVLTTGYRVVTTTIDAEFLTFQANYDPENAEQAASYQAMLSAYAEIATLSSNISANYAAINAQIAIIQANLALWVELDMSLVLTNKSLMTLTINTTLPNVVYNSQSLNLSNTNDDSQEYIVTTFPNNYVDLTKTFSSSTINFGTQFEDGVYKLNLSWSADNDMEFSGVTYCLVMTQVDCGIAQVVANRPNCKNVRSQLNMLMFFRDMALDAYANEDYTTCNFYINKCIIILNQSGCGCGCN
jgi:hypothetical protein